MNDSDEPVTDKPAGDGDVTMVNMPAFTDGTPADKRFCHVPVLMTLIGESHPMRMVIEAPEIVIGRSKEVDFSLRDSTASRQHAKIVYVNCTDPDARPSVYLYDLNSRNGLTVNGVQVQQHVPLRDNARIAIGDVHLGYYVLSIPRRDIAPASDEERSDAGAGTGEKKGDQTEPQDAAGGESPDASVARPSIGSATPSQFAARADGLKRIAIVESDYDSANDLRQRLDGTERYSAIVFRKLANAIDNFETRRPDMILLDGEMEDCPCVEACRRIKENDALKGIPIILLFTSLDAQLVRAGLKAGAQSYLVKPIENLTQLTNRIDIHMNINRMMSNIGQGS